MSYDYPREFRIEYLKEAIGIKNLKGLQILDWGGNHGNLLKDGVESHEIDPTDYTCIDVDARVMEESRKAFPDASWITRCVTHPVYNAHKDQKDIDFTPHLNKYDVVYAYSVYTHDTWEKAFEDLDILYKLAKPRGKICFSYVDPKSAEIFRRKRINEFGYSVEPDAFDNIVDWCYFVNHDTLTKEYDREKSCQYFVAIFNPNWLKDQIEFRWGNCKIYNPDWSNIKDWSKDPWQSSMVITKD